MYYCCFSYFAEKVLAYWYSFSQLKKAVDRVTRYESQLTERLGEDEQTILMKLIRSQHEINSITALENFILGFRMGARIMAECMDENDGDTRELTDHG